MKLTVSGAALADLKRLQAFLADRNVNAARRAIAVIVRAIDSLVEFPEAGVAGLRDLIVPFGRSTYISRFAHDHGTGEVVIVRIWHGREARIIPGRSSATRR